MSYRIAGIDVHKRMLAVVASEVEVYGEYQFERRQFGTSLAQLRALAAWRLEQQVEEVVMESTAQYWKPVWGGLERHWQPACQKWEGARPTSGGLHLAQAKSNRARRGRKNDFADAERLVRRLVANELTLSFVPDVEQRLWRTVMRTKYQLRCNQVQYHSAPLASGPGPTAGGGPRPGSRFGTADRRGSGRHRRDLSFRSQPFFLGGRLPGSRRDGRSQSQSSVSEGQPSYAAHPQSGSQRRGQAEGKHLRDPLSPLCAAYGAQSNHRGDCSSSLSLNLEDSAPRSPLRGTGPDREQKVEAEPREENDPRASKSRLPGRIHQF
jgi:Transposase